MKSFTSVIKFVNGKGQSQTARRTVKAATAAKASAQIYYDLVEERPDSENITIKILQK